MFFFLCVCMCMYLINFDTHIFDFHKYISVELDPLAIHSFDSNNVTPGGSKGEKIEMKKIQCNTKLRRKKKGEEGIHV